MDRNRFAYRIVIAVACVLCYFNLLFGQKSIYLDSLVKQTIDGYISAMVYRGKDTYGDKHSPLFASILDRQTFSIIQREKLPYIEGERIQDRVAEGSNLLHDDKLYALLLSVSDKKRDEYLRDQVYTSFSYFMATCQSANTGLFAWGEHLYWDLKNDTVGFLENYELHEADEWSHWDIFLQLNPSVCFRFGLGEWQHQVENQETGNFSRHARWSRHEPQKNADFPRYAGQMVERWSKFLVNLPDSSVVIKKELQKAIACIVHRMIENQQLTSSKTLPAFRDAPYGWHENNLKMAVSMAEGLKTLEKYPSFDTIVIKKITQLILSQDSHFIKHQKNIHLNGFLLTFDMKTLKPIDRKPNRAYSVPWDSGYGFQSHASIAKLCGKRCYQVEESNPSIAQQYKTLILQVADFYATSHPDENRCYKPHLFADIIDVLILSYQLTQKKVYLQEAEKYVELSLCLFYDKESPLPKATSCHQHYESLTGGPDLMYALWNFQQTVGALPQGKE